MSIWKGEGSDRDLELGGWDAYMELGGGGEIRI